MDVRALPNRALVVSVVFATMWDTNADRKRVVLGSIFWTLTLVGYGIIQPIVAAAWPSGYSFTDHAISDLGNTECGMFPNLANGEIYVCSPLHAWMNGSFIVLGVLTALGAWLTAPAWPRRCASSVGLTLTALGGLCVSLVGVFPENVDLDTHTLVALLQLPLQLAGFIALIIACGRRCRWRAAWTLVCGLVSLLAAVSFFSGHYGALGMGGVERLMFDTFTVWTGVIGVVLLFRHGRGPAVDAPRFGG